MIISMMEMIITSEKVMIIIISLSEMCLLVQKKVDDSLYG